MESYITDRVSLYCGNCFDYLPLIETGSVDAIIADLPYGTTSCKWDIVLPFDKLWEQYNRIIKPNGAVCLFGREPFTSAMVMSNPKNYKHKWVWNKKQSGSFQNAKYMPLQIDEDIIVFAKGKCNYYPIMRKGKMRKRGGAKEKSRLVGGGFQDGFENYSDMYYPVNIYELANPRLNKLHPTEKPVELMEYLVKTYTNEGDIVLDNTMGVGTTILAALKNGRRAIGM
jgi:site-specific DNA-methyltransferase (adenine-specific)